MKWSSDLYRSDFGGVAWPSRATNEKATVVNFVGSLVADATVGADRVIV